MVQKLNNFYAKRKKRIRNLAVYCIDASIKNTATNCEVKVENIISETVNLRNKKIENSDRSDILSVNITTYINKKKSSTQFTYIDKEEYKCNDRKMYRGYKTFTR